jgi:hypothetical protein
MIGNPMQGWSYPERNDTPPEQDYDADALWVVLISSANDCDVGVSVYDNEGDALAAFKGFVLSHLDEYYEKPTGDGLDPDYLEELGYWEDNRKEVIEDAVRYLSYDDDMRSERICLQQTRIIHPKKED